MIRWILADVNLDEVGEWSRVETVIVEDERRYLQLRLEFPTRGLKGIGRDRDVLNPQGGRARQRRRLVKLRRLRCFWALEFFGCSVDSDCADSSRCVGYADDQFAPIRARSRVLHASRNLPVVGLFHNQMRYLVSCLAAVIVFHTGCVLSVMAQEADSAPSVLRPSSELTDIQRELHELQLRAQELEALEKEFSQRLGQYDSSRSLADGAGIEPLSDSSLLQASLNSEPPTDASACEQNDCPSGIAPAPCVPCPRVTTLSPYFNLQIFGAVKLDMLFNTGRPVSPGVPFFLAPDSLTGLSQDTVDIHARQTTLGAALAGPTLGEFQTGGLLIGMLFNDNVIADRYGFLPLQAYGELKNEDWRFSAGLQFDVFAPGMPTVLPFSALAASGNAGNSFRGSVRLERYLTPVDDVQWTFQTALSDPITTTISPAFAISEDNGWPNVEGRIALGLGLPEQVGLGAQRPFEVGLSGVVGQIRTTVPPGDRVVADVWGVATDFRWKANQIFGFAGEVYTGQTLGTYNGAVLQTVNPESLLGIHSTGGWLEGFVYLTSSLHSHTGYAIDDPRDSDVSVLPEALGRTRNSIIYSNLIWDINAAFRVGFEVAWRETDYRSALNPDNEGIGFHTQFQWSF